jgi:hypothetical protein
MQLRDATQTKHLKQRSETTRGAFIASECSRKWYLVRMLEVVPSMGARGMNCLRQINNDGITLHPDSYIF